MTREAWQAEPDLAALANGELTEEELNRAFIAFTDRPPFPLTVRGFRQDWYHLVIAPLPGLHPDLASRDEPSETSSTDLDSADLLSASAKLEEDTEENTTNVYGGEAVLECSMGYSESKRKRRVFVSLSAKPRGKARLECAFYNWRTGQWSMWQPKFDKDGEAYHSLDLDHIHPALFIAHVKLTVRSADVRSFVRIRNFSVEVKPVEEEEE